MTLKLTNEGEAQMLENSLRATTPEAVTLKLYTNNFDTGDDSTASSYTEATGASYAAKPLTRAGWNAPVAGSGANPGVITYGTVQQFDFTDAITIVGYYLVGSVSGKVYWGERLYSGAGQAFGNGDALKVTPRFTLNSAS